MKIKKSASKKPILSLETQMSQKKSLELLQYEIKMMISVIKINYFEEHSITIQNQNLFYDYIKKSLL